MRVWLFFLILAVSSYLLGIGIDGIVMGDDSRLMNFIKTGSLDMKWVPFSTTQEKLGSFGVDDPSGSFVVPLITYAQLAENTQMIITHGSVSFGLASEIIDPDGIPNTRDEYLTDGITQCNFHSFDDVPFDTCVLCTLTSVEENGEHTPLAQGQVDLPDGYAASTKLEIQITEFAFDGSNNINNVDGVRVQLCDNGLGCTSEFWQQETSLQYWPESIAPDDSFEIVFQRDISSIEGWIGPADPTLLEVLSSSGTPVNDLGSNAVAALLNSEILGESFAYSPDEIIAMTQLSIDDAKYETTKDLFATENELGCPYAV